MSVGPKTPETGPTIGSYRLLQPLGSGGMSAVFRAVHVQTGHEVAVKVLSRTLARDPALLQRFLREARSAEALRHPNIVSIFDRGVDDGRHYLVLEYVPGGDFSERVRKGGPLPVAEAVDVIKAAALGLRHAAGEGVIHRDVKPANLLRTADGVVKVADLGLALHPESDDERVTHEGTTVGTVDYIAPEQARDSRSASERSDIYSLGCTLYYLLTGSPPYPGGSLAETMGRHCLEPVPDPRRLRPELPAALALVILRMMAKAPADRFRDYDELLEALDAVNAARAAESVLALVPGGTGAGQGGGGEGVAVGLGNGRSPDATAVDAADSRLSESSLAALGASDAGRSALAALASSALAESGLSSATWIDGSAQLPALPAPARPAPRRFLQTSDGAWILLWTLIGLGVIVLVIGTDQLIRATRQEADIVIAGAETPLSTPLARSPSLAEAARPAGAEPTDRAAGKAPATPSAREVEARSLPDWAGTAVPERIAGPFLTVRRVVDPAQPGEVPTLRRAFDAAGGTIEIADDGPLLEDDWRIFGAARLVRARPGYRPILRVVAPRGEAVRDRAAVVPLGGKDLTLDGVDLVVDVGALPRNQSALFLCQGGALTLRHCSVTVVNPAGQPFALVRTLAASRPTRVRLETTLVRGAALTMLDLVGGSAELAASGSVLLTGAAPLFACTRDEPGAGLRLFVARSLLAGGGPFLDVHGTAAGGPHPPVVVRAVGSTFARVEGGRASSLITAGAGDVDWRGESNTYAGWESWLSAGTASGASAPAAWPATDARRRESSQAPALPTEAVWTSPEGLRPLVPEQGATLDRVAAPRPFLREKTVAAFDPPPVPGLAPDLSIAGATAPPPPQVGAAAAAVLELSFDLAAPPWEGDLGLFLAERLQARPDATRIRVRIVGTGEHRWTPLRLPDGVSLEVQVEPLEAGGRPSCWWLPAGSAPGEALIDVRGGDLLLSGVVLSSDEPTRLRSLIRVEDGHLVLRGCWFRSRAAAAAGVASLVAFRAARTPPSTPRAAPAPFATPVDRPVARLDECLLITNGAAVSAEVGRGLVALTQCAVAAGGSALELRPAAVDRTRFEADLRLERCTLAARRSIVALGGWPGPLPGPDRPWLVASQDCAFLDDFEPPTREGVLLDVQGDALGQGTLAWQSSNDAYEVSRFTAWAGAPPASDLEPDVRRQWVDLWGPNHIRGATGPTGAQGLPSVRLFARLRPGDIAPSDLQLDPNTHLERQTLNVGAELTRLGIKPRSARPPRRR